MIIRNEYGKLSLPDGSYPSRTIPGKNMRERVDNYWDAQGYNEKESAPAESFATNFLEGPEECVFSIDIDPPTEPEQQPTPADDVDFEIQLLQTQINSLREAQVLAFEKGKKKLQFDGVEIMKRHGPPKPGSHIPPPPPSGSLESARDPARSQANHPSPTVGGKPGTRAGDRPPTRPQGPMRPVTIPPKPVAEDPKFRYQSAVETSVKTSELAERALDAKITITTRELLAASADVRRHIKELVTSKKVSTNMVETDELDTYLFHFEPEPSRTPFPDLVKYDTPSAAAPSLPLRVIYPSFAPGVEPECILDGGAQVVVMRKDIWEKLGVPIASNRAMPMESANARTTMTLGLVENLPVQLGPITIYLQVQVVDEAPFEVLLGRPFFDVTSCSEISTSGGRHEIQVRDPKDGTPYVFATKPRFRRSQKANLEKPRATASVNFRA
jgi:hypothetical protein